MKKLNNMLFDAGGPILYLAIIGVPIFLGILVLAIIVVTVILIRKAIKNKKSDPEKPAE